MSSGLGATLLASVLLHCLGFTALSMVGGSLWSPPPPSNLITTELLVAPPPPAVPEPLPLPEPEPDPPAPEAAPEALHRASASRARDAAQGGADHAAKARGKTAARARQDTTSSTGAAENPAPVQTSAACGGRTSITWFPSALTGGCPSRGER